jgi:hypothetical protein
VIDLSRQHIAPEFTAGSAERFLRQNELAQSQPHSGLIYVARCARVTAQLPAAAVFLASTAADNKLTATGLRARRWKQACHRFMTTTVAIPFGTSVELRPVSD